MVINRRKRGLNLKIVYYGPALSGKTTNLQYVHANVNPDLRGDLISVKTREDRTIFFDYLQIEMGRISGLRPRFNLYTVPGQMYHGSIRRLVLQGADGIVFVADSHPDRLRANLKSLRDMARDMRELGLDPREIPITIQFNKRDMGDAVAEEKLSDYLRLNKAVPYHLASAINGVGVFDTLKASINRVIARVQKRMKGRIDGDERATVSAPKMVSVPDNPAGAR